jgi:putative ABC transport system permease protein
MASEKSLEPEIQVITLFVSVFIKIFMIASLVAIPISWFVSYKWLQGFAYRIR